MALAAPKPISFYEETFAKTDKTDAVLVVDGIKLHVNKALLSYHSDYFNTLFNSEFKEKSMEEIEIKEVDFEQFATLLSLVHANPIGFEVSAAVTILKLAERFLMSAPRKVAELVLLSREDRFENLRLGDKYKLNELMDDSLKRFERMSSFREDDYELDPEFFNSLSDKTVAKILDRLNESYNDVVAPQPPPANSIESAFVKTDKTDAILVVDGKKLHVNKAVLSCHFGYFETLFDSEFKEKSMDGVEIENVNFEHFATLLSLVQVEPIDPTSEDVDTEKVLELADRFQARPSINYYMELYMIKSKMHPKEKVRIADKYQMESLLMNGVKGFWSPYDLKSWPYQDLSDRTKSLIFKNMLTRY